MKVNKIIGKNVIDEEGNFVGKVGNIDIDEQNGYIKGIDVKERQGVLYYDPQIITFNQIEKISDDIFINTMIYI
ncbi:PRC-barrel domain protein [Methanobrevibacter cuticularis]|uniref:PRC-barrel domain protein n=1 Tax=Methanobrevibacter cuticularis TaxID=47311 RepID=A0A166FGP5_9EURY|nr:PRC-barrel domain-containing protein [Methanobrevibacter cuticularis]KZX17654.1 PRC-barrel domain protein [Methanobrevibacter cuticularis]